VGSFTEELHGAGAEPPQGFKGDRAECVTGARVVCVVGPALVSVPKSCGVAGSASSGTKVRSCEGMDERDIGEHLARAGAQVAMEVPACLGAVCGTRRKPRILPLAAGGKAQAANELDKTMV
jgi:hypothetical protein